MKNNIEYYYNLKINELNEINDYYSFDILNYKYYFVILKRPLEDLGDLYNVSLELINRRILCHEIIRNKDNKLITNIEDINYILLKLNQDESREIYLYDIVDIQNKLILSKDKSKLYRNDWGNLWSQKIDYFEYQISQLGKEKEIILNSFSYFLGLAENAISYVNHTNENYMGNYILTLSHKRLYYPNYSLNYYNPLSFIFDLRVRDVAEYIKSKFIKQENILDELEMYFNSNNLSNYEFRMFYARLLYPSFYFDVYEKIMNNLAKEEELISIISLVKDYEIFLKRVYVLISKYTLIDEIDWLKKDVSTL